MYSHLFRHRRCFPLAGLILCLASCYFSSGPVAASSTKTLLSPSPQSLTLEQEGVSPDSGGWRIESSYARVIKLGEFPVNPEPPGVLRYRARLMSQELMGTAILEMWCRVPGRGEFFSRSLDQTISGNSGWVEVSTPFFLKEGEKPDMVKLNLLVNGKGTVWIEDVKVTWEQK